MFSEPFLASSNPFIQQAVARLSAQNNLPTEPTKEQSTAVKSITQKQKWKMLKNIPGSGKNTWSAMSLLNKGLKPMNHKTAANSKSKILDWLLSMGKKPAAPPKPTFHVDSSGGVSKGLPSRDLVPVRGTELGPVREQTIDIPFLPKAPNPSWWNKGVDFAKQHPFVTGGTAAGALGTGGAYGAYRGIKNQIATSTDKVKNDMQQYLQPTIDRVNNAVAPFQGNSQTYFGGVWEGFLQFLHRLMGGGRAQSNQYTNALTGTGPQVAKQLTAAKTKTSSFPSQKKLTSFDALNIALNGSPQFHKNASSVGTVRPDAVLKAHVILADRMRKFAEMLNSAERGNGFISVFRRAADQVVAGVPAKVALFAEVGLSKKYAEQVMPVVEDIAARILREYDEADFQRRLASAEQKKKIADAPPLTYNNAQRVQPTLNQQVYDELVKQRTSNMTAQLQPTPAQKPDGYRTVRDQVYDALVKQRTSKLTARDNYYGLGRENNNRLLQSLVLGRQGGQSDLLQEAATEALIGNIFKGGIPKKPFEIANQDAWSQAKLYGGVPLLAGGAMLGADQYARHHTNAALRKLPMNGAAVPRLKGIGRLGKAGLAAGLVSAIAAPIGYHSSMANDRNDLKKADYVDDVRQRHQEIVDRYQKQGPFVGTFGPYSPLKAIGLTGAASAGIGGTIGAGMGALTSKRPLKGGIKGALATGVLSLLGGTLLGNRLANQQYNHATKKYNDAQEMLRLLGAKSGAFVKKKT